MSLPPIIPPTGCPNGPVATCTPVALRTAEQGDPNSIEGVAASLLVDFNPGFTDGNFTLSAINDGAFGNDLMFEVTVPITHHMTSASLFGNIISVSPGSKSRFLVSSSNIVFAGTYRLAGNYPNTTRPYWQKINSGANTVILAFPFEDTSPTGSWQFMQNGITHFSTADVTYDIELQPEGLSFSPTGGEAPASTLSLTAAVSDTQQIINAINTSATAADVVVASTDGLAKTASSVESPAQPLEGGVNAKAGEVPSGIGQFCRVGPYPSPPAAFEYDWFIAETMNSWRKVFE